MKKFFLLFLSLMIINIISAGTALAESQEGVTPINALVEPQLFIDLSLKIDTCIDVEGNKFSLEMKNGLSEEIFFELDEKQQNLVLEHSNANDYIVVLDLCSRNKENPYPEIEPLSIKIEIEENIGGSRRYLLGKDYRFYRIENDILCEADVMMSDDKVVSFTIEKLGYYVLYYNPCVYSVDFFEDEIVRNEDGHIVNEVYFTATDLAQFDNLYFPEIPEKESYVFTGWKHDKRTGAYYSRRYVEWQYDWLLDEKRIYACDMHNLYASWCPEEEYTPLEVTIESDKKITKGKEDGAEIILTLSEGKLDEVINGNIENDWEIVGNDELSISSVERIDDTTAKLTLSGNSSDKYKTGEIQVEFSSDLYISHEGFGDNFEVHEIADIQLDENGIKKAMFISDNSITLEKQKKSSGGSSRPSSYIVEFNTNGGTEIGNVQVERNELVTEPKVPVREGFVFKGWYTDAELTDEYDFAQKVTKSFTLYAAWEEDDSNKIILTVGEKEAIVFGKKVTNDVAPLIKNDRVMLPIRFVAQSLDASVSWNKEAPNEVKIAKGDKEIVICIGEERATVNGEEVTLDTPAFLENDRTYLPVRFVAESLGCNVEWNHETKTVVITKV